MKRLFHILFITFILVMGMVEIASAAGSGTVVVDSPTGIPAGSTAWVYVNITNTYNPQIAGFVFDLIYDPTVISLYLDAGGANYTSYYNGTVGPSGWSSIVTQGTVGKIRCTFSDNNVPPVPIPNGQSNLIGLKFTSLKNDGSISALNVSVADISDTNGNTITDSLIINNGLFATYSATRNLTPPQKSLVLTETPLLPTPTISTPPLTETPSSLSTPTISTPSLTETSPPYQTPSRSSPVSDISACVAVGIIGICMVIRQQKKARGK
jgi:hypothetical protein